MASSAVVVVGDGVRVRRSWDGVGFSSLYCCDCVLGAPLLVAVVLGGGSVGGLLVGGLLGGGLLRRVALVGSSHFGLGGGSVEGLLVGGLLGGGLLRRREVAS